MLHKKGFTLIELLIVITIIAILAGAVIPYVQQYVEDSRISRAKQDLDEVRNALMRYETDQSRPYVKSDISDLVGPYMNKAIADPWGQPYYVSNASSTCYSLGPDREADTGDEISANYRPPLAISRATWEDTNTDLTVNTGDTLTLRFTRALVPEDLTAIVPGDFTLDPLATINAFTDHKLINSSMTMSVKLTFDSTGFVPGKTTISITSPNTRIIDGNKTKGITGQLTVIKPVN